MPSCAQGGHAGHSSFIVCLLCAVVNGYGTGEETELSAGISFWAVGLYGPEGPPSSSPPCALLLIRTQDSGSTLGSMALSSAEWEDLRGQELAGHPRMGALHPHPQSAVGPPLRAMALEQSRSPQRGAERLWEAVQAVAPESSGV